MEKRDQDIMLIDEVIISKIYMIRGHNINVGQ